MFWTNPRPLRRVKLGVGSFSGGGRRNARDGFLDAGICGLLAGDCLRRGWMGRAREGVVTTGEAHGGFGETGELGVCCIGVYGRERFGVDDAASDAVVAVFKFACDVGRRR